MITWAAYIKDYFLYYVLSLYKLSSEYGEGPSRATLWLICLLSLPLIFFCTGPELEVASKASNSIWAVPSSNAIENWLQFLPLVRVPEIGGAGWAMRLIMIVGQLLITIQAALFGFALRNRFRR